jgi:DNA-binding transcriptional LysR family regulator
VPTRRGGLSSVVLAFRPGGDLDLWAVRCLLVLAEERHYIRAAARLHMSQPGLSRVIAGLEQRVGATLIERSTRPLRLTTQGDILVYHGWRLLEQQRAALDEILESVRAPSEHVRRPGWSL